MIAGKGNSFIKNENNVIINHQKRKQLLFTHEASLLEASERAQDKDYQFFPVYGKYVEKKRNISVPEFMLQNILFYIVY